MTQIEPNSYLQDRLSQLISDYARFSGQASGKLITKDVTEILGILFGQGVRLPAEDLVAMAILIASMAPTRRLYDNAELRLSSRSEAAYQTILLQVAREVARWLVTLQDPGFGYRRRARRDRTQTLLAQLKHWQPEQTTLPTRN